MSREAGRAAPAAGGRAAEAGGGDARTILVRDLGGPRPYGEVLGLQRRLAREKIEGRRGEDLLLLVEHEPVVTLGRGAREGNVVAAGLLEARGAEVVEIERGGDVTYHGPGQLVGYPILDLARWRKDLHWYVRRLEEALILALEALGLPAFRVDGYTGVWVGERAADAGSPAAGGGPAAGAAGAPAAGAARKVASIGVHVSRWVTWHGFALNVTREPLEWFPLIVPCGIPGVRMTSLEAEGVRPAPAALREAIARGLAAAFDAEVAPAAGATAAVAAEAAAGEAAAKRDARAKAATAGEAAAR